MSRLDDALALVAIDSVSRGEATIAHHVAVVLGRNPELDVERIGDNVVARTTGHHATRLLVAGHLDTVPGDASAATIVGEELRGVGACDMKGSLAVIVGHWKSLEEIGGSLSLAGARYQSTKSLWITGLADRIPLHENVDAAILA